MTELLLDLDRFEGDRAVLVSRTEPVEMGTIPRSWLPSGVGEGDALRVRLETDPRSDTRGEIADLYADLVDPNASP